MLNSDKKKTKCKCPMCGDIYEVMEFFTGRGLMRRRCWQCNDMAEKEIDDNMIYADTGKQLSWKTPSDLNCNKGLETMVLTF